MKHRARILAAALAAAMTVSLSVPAGAAGEAQPAPVTGSITATLRLDYRQNMRALNNHPITVTLRQGDSVLLSQALTGEQAGAQGGACPVTLTARNSDGGELNPGWQSDPIASPAYLDLAVSNLPQGDYDLDFSGVGYKPYTRRVTLAGYAQQVILGTGDATFTLGDVDGSGAVDEADRSALSAALGSADEADWKVYDLNGDGAVDIIDLAYVGRLIHAGGEAQVLDTVLLAPPVDTEALKAALKKTVEVTGDLENLFQDNGQGVTLAARDPEADVALPLSLTAPVEMEQIEIVTPDGAGAIQKGSVTVEGETGGPRTIPFDLTLPEGVHALGRAAAGRVVTISLGSRVPVKKVTITVTQTAGGSFAAVESIRFLRDIVPENPVAPNSKVRSVTAAAGDGQVSLKWGELPNVMGYEVSYAPKDGSKPAQTLQVNVPRAGITGLENLQPYTFTVTPTSDGWRGEPSDPVEATPQPASVPDPVDMVAIQARDGALDLSWKKGKSATYYEVYYTDVKDAPTAAYLQSGGTLTGTSATITGLTNGTTYYVYLLAGNAMGMSGHSRISEGTPAAAAYQRPAGIPTLGVLDHTAVASITLTDANNWSGTVPAEARSASNMADGDYRTSWTSQSWGDGNWSRSKQVNVTFREPVDLSAVLWVPRLDGEYPANLKAYTITAATADGGSSVIAPTPNDGKTPPVASWWRVKNSPAVTHFAVLPFEPLTGVTGLSITLDQQRYSAISLSEILFLEYDPARDLADAITGLFADELHTALKPGTERGEIDALKARLEGGEQNYYLNVDTMKDEIALAGELLEGKTSGVVLDGLGSRSNARDSALYGQSGSQLQPLGAAARAGEELTVYAEGIPQGETVTLLATQFNAEASAWQAPLGEVENGRNILTVPKIGSQNTPRGGSLYYTYTGEQGADIKLHIRRAVDMPLLELSGWYGMTGEARQAAVGAYLDELEGYLAGLNLNNNTKQTNCLNVTEISMPSVLLSIPASSVQDHAGGSREERAQALLRNVLAWEDVMHIAKTTQGIDKTYGESGMESRQNIRCMQMFAGAFMYAAGNHVGIGFGSCGGMVTGRPIPAEGLPPDTPYNGNGLFGWGIAHEIGHNMDKLGKAEITNNIYSLMVQTYDGRDNTLLSRLENSGKYGEIFTKVAQGFPGASNNVFVQLGMYWQLHLAYDGGRTGDSGPMDFYNAFFKLWKSGSAAQGAASYDDKVALAASSVADRDLSAFFTRWGMRLSEETRQALAQYPEEPRAIWYLNDDSRRARLAGDDPARGEVTAEAVKTGDNEVEITISAGLTQGEILGYEILRDGRPIGFTTETTYTDTIGSGNHRAFAYSVRACDTLGNYLGDAVSAGSIRVAYDKTVPADAYDIARDGETGAVTLTLHEVTAASGLKLTGDRIPAEGGYTVTVTDGGETERAAKRGDFSEANQAVDDPDSYLAYFNKPGADSGDTRIWTYDVKSVTITGLPADMDLADVRLISYAGDDVAFLEEGSVGVLAGDYRYGGGEDDVIAAGTLVIAGTYRGDPRYNTLLVQGQFTAAALTTEGQEEAGPVTRPLDGYALFFAAVPEDGAVSDISDGLFLFVPDVQREAQLQGENSNCNTSNLLPSRLMVELYRTDDPGDPSGKRLTASTLWIDAPGGDTLPTLVLEETT